MFSRRYLPAGLLLLSVASGWVEAQPVPSTPLAITSNVPDMKCQGLPQTWDNCVNAVRYPNGNVYQGEFHHGQREGLGVIQINAAGVSDHDHVLSNEPSIYAGEFHEGRLNGHGAWLQSPARDYLEPSKTIFRSQMLHRGTAPGRNPCGITASRP